MNIVAFDSVSLLFEKNEKIIEEVRLKYHFQGDTKHLQLFNNLLMFYDKQLFDKLDIELPELDRLINAYFWYTKYLKALIKQDIPTSDHEQVRLKIIEEIDRLEGKTDWSFIKEIDELL